MSEAPYCFDCGVTVDAHKSEGGSWIACWQSIMVGGMRIVQPKSDREVSR